MSTETVTLRAPPRRGSADHWLRGAVARRLQPLTGGRLVVNDPWGQWSVGGPGVQAELSVRDSRFYRDLVLGGSLGAAEAYLAGRWSSADLTGLFRLLLNNLELVDGVNGASGWLGRLMARRHHRRRGNTRAGSRRNVHDHYDLGNDFFALFLDETLTYSGAIFTGPDQSLADAQRAKLDRICRKLALTPADDVIEIGTGWGSFALHAASRYGCRVTTTTLSRAQHRRAVERVAAAGLSDHVEVLLRDYRELAGQYDKLVSVEMIEAVGHELLPGYFDQVAQLLKPDGAALVQAITMPERRYPRYRKTPDFIQRYVFPGSCVPSLGAMVNAMGARSDLRIVHLEDIGAHYATTLRHWRQRLAGQHEAVLALGYPERLLRLWEYYLSYCEAGFAERYLGDVQLLLHRAGNRSAPLLPPLP
jgi:cyclopropane-fatty-acyl-phospholipid synthase